MSDHDPNASAVMVHHWQAERLEPHAETTHTEHALSYLADGWFRMEHGQAVEARPGTVTLVPAGVPHRTIDGRDLDLWLVGFCASCVGLDETQLLMSPFRRVRFGALPLVTIAKSRRRKLVRLFRELDEEAKRGAPESPELARSLLLLVLARSGGRCRPARRSSRKGRWCRKRWRSSSSVPSIQSRCATWRARCTARRPT